MRRSKTENISTIIRQFLRQEGLETPLNQQRIIKAWPTVMGQAISLYTQNIFITNQTLHVYLTSSIIRNELMMQRQSLVTKLNATVDAQVITDIMFH